MELLFCHESLPQHFIVSLVIIFYMLWEQNLALDFLVSESSGHEYYSRVAHEALCLLIVLNAHSNPTRSLRLLPLFFRPETEQKKIFVPTTPQVNSSSGTRTLICTLLTPVACPFSGLDGFMPYRQPLDTKEEKWTFYLSVGPSTHPWSSRKISEAF